jgi:hypothetical protein
LTAQLLFAARELAWGQRRPAVPEDNEPPYCAECTRFEIDGELPHESSCRTGRVLKIIDELINPNEKEAAPDGGVAQAADGIRLPGLKTRLCLKCGLRDGKWDYEVLGEKNVDLSLCGLNQCVGMESGTAVLYTHCCQEGGGE